MSYQLKLISKPEYLHPIVTGLNSKENVARYVEELLRECISRDCPTQKGET